MTLPIEPIKILLVDDTPENLVALQALLRRDDVELLLARSGAEALELLLVHTISLALLDVQMPEMDGFELAELMRGTERTKHVPIIFVTAGTRDPARVFKGYGSGAVDFLFKPIEPHVLTSKVDVFVALARERQQLAQLLRLNELFVGILGHDLRNPLGAMLTGGELLARLIKDERQLGVLARMQDAGRRMAEMIEQLLDLTRARLGDGMGFMQARSTIDLGELVQRAVDELRVVHGGRDIAIRAHGGCTTVGDPLRLLQLFSNLLANALAHGAPGSAITATIGPCDRDAIVEIHNAGAIPPELIPALFEPFRKAGGSAGLGLGLFIAQQIAIAHGGSLVVTSDPVHGTTFALHLPRAQDAIVLAS